MDNNTKLNNTELNNTELIKLNDKDLFNKIKTILYIISKKKKLKKNVLVFNDNNNFKNFINDIEANTNYMILRFTDNYMSTLKNNDGTFIGLHTNEETKEIILDNNNNDKILNQFLLDLNRDPLLTNIFVICNKKIYLLKFKNNFNTKNIDNINKNKYEYFLNVYNNINKLLKNKKYDDITKNNIFNMILMATNQTLKNNNMISFIQKKVLSDNLLVIPNEKYYNNYIIDIDNISLTYLTNYKIVDTANMNKYKNNVCYLNNECNYVYLNMYVNSDNNITTDISILNDNINAEYNSNFYLFTKYSNLKYLENIHTHKLFNKKILLLNL